MKNIAKNIANYLLKCALNVTRYLRISIWFIESIPNKTLEFLKILLLSIIDLVLRLFNFVFTTYVFSIYRYVKESIFTLTILIITWLLIANSRLQILIDFKVEFLGIVYTILFIDFSMFMRSALKSIKFKTMFMDALYHYLNLLSSNISREYKIEFVEDKVFDLEEIIDNLYSQDETELIENLKVISSFLEQVEKQTKHIIEIYDSILIVELRTLLLEIMFRVNNNNLFKIYQIDNLLKNRNSEDIMSVSYQLSRFYKASMSDSDRIEGILYRILRSNVHLYFDLVNILSNVEKCIRTNYDPFFECNLLKHIKLHLTHHSHH